jgi:hypothetical protein
VKNIIMYKFYSNLILKNNGGKLIIKSIQTLVKYFFKYLAKLLGKVLFEEMWKYSRQFLTHPRLCCLQIIFTLWNSSFEGIWLEIELICLSGEKTNKKVKFKKQFRKCRLMNLGLKRNDSTNWTDYLVGWL